MNKDHEDDYTLIMNIGSGETVVMPDIYGTDFGSKFENLSLEHETGDDQSDDGEEPVGINPYDTAVLYGK